MSEKIFGLIGRKLGHSFSVPIHKMLGNENYRLYELEPEEISDFLKKDALGGINVTIPYKKLVMQYLDVISPAALEIGSVNTIFRRDGILHGDNTDAYGFEQMANLAGISFNDKKVVILGSGGASLTAQWVSKKQGARQIVVISRSGEDNYDNLHLHYDAEIIVNATPVGMYPNNGNVPCSLAPFAKCVGVLDMIYNPHRTALIMEAERLGIPCSDGLPMLVAQAKAAEEMFFGKAIDNSENSRIYKTLRIDTENIVLIGMPGCGKNSVGERLAEICGRDIIDIDAEIVKRANRSIPEIFASDGESGFREIERQVVADAGRESGKIIITGGGVIKTPDNYPSLHQNGRIYHIERDISSLPRDGRPLSASADLQMMYKERLPLYEIFRDATIVNDSSIDKCAEKIWSDFFENSCN